MSIDLTLSRISALLSNLPPYTRPTIHITGTNGKGSVCALTSSILIASGLSVGRFNSPHLISPNDCISVNGIPVSPSTYADVRKEVEDANRFHDVGVSLFEILTLTALLIFERAAVDVVVLEVGMGGKRDATNVIPDEAVLVSAMTAVDLDHQAFLGTTVAEIAKEKVGIWRAGKPFVLGPQKYEDVDAVVLSSVDYTDVIRAETIETRAWDESDDGPLESRSSTVSRVNNITPRPVLLRIPRLQPINALLPLQGTHQLANLGTVAGIIYALLTHPSCSARGTDWKKYLTPQSIARGIRTTEWPGRLSFHTYTVPSTGKNVSILADGAHNPSSAATLADYISELLSTNDGPSITSITFILALSHSPPKTPTQTLTPLLTHPSLHSSSINLGVALLRFSPPAGMPWVTSVPPPALSDVVKSLAPQTDLWYSSSDNGEDIAGQESLRQGLDWASRREAGVDQGLIILAGSLYLVADFYRLLGGIPPRTV